LPADAAIELMEAIRRTVGTAAWNTSPSWARTLQAARANRQIALESGHLSSPVGAFATLGSSVSSRPDAKAHDPVAQAVRENREWVARQEAQEREKAEKAEKAEKHPAREARKAARRQSGFFAQIRNWLRGKD
jgi:hypothetical protein